MDTMKARISVGKHEGILTLSVSLVPCFHFWASFSLMSHRAGLPLEDGNYFT